MHCQHSLYFSCTVTRAIIVTNISTTPISAKENLLSSWDWLNHNMLLQWQWATLPAQMVWISGQSASGLVVHPPAINHPPIQPSEKVISLEMVARKQKPNFHNRAKQGNSATFMFIEPQWIHYLFGTISWLTKYVCPHCKRWEHSCLREFI